MSNKELIKDLVKLQILYIRYAERNTALRFKTHRDMQRVIMSNKLCCTYQYAVDNLYVSIIKLCKNEYLVNTVTELKEKIESSEIKDLRFGLEPQRKFSKDENELNDYMLQRTLFMLNEMNGIKDTSELIGISETAIKQACQQERLLNTKKIGKSWMVHLRECMTYWNVTLEEDGLYKNWTY